jgi:hypothetical protein
MPLPYTSAVFADLRTLHAEIKFNESDFYAGAATEEIRQICESRVNAFIEAVLELLRKKADEAEAEDVIGLARKLVVEFEEEEEVEDAERADDYINEVMTILEIEDWEEVV